MAASRWISVAVMAGLAAGLSARALRAADPAPGSDVDQLNSIIISPASSQAQRDEAARRLMSRQVPAARDMLHKILSTGGVDSELAVVRALDEDSNPDPQLVSTLIKFLGSERLHEAASRALARYTGNDTARDSLIAFAKDTAQAARLRVLTIRALGGVVDKRVATTLLDLLADPRQGAVVQNAAADALQDMTGLVDNGRDLQRWKQWAAANASRSDADWKAVVYATRSAHLGDVSQRYSRLLVEMESLLSDQYQQAPARDKAAVLMRYLNGSEPDVRAIGARIVGVSFLNGQGFPDEARDRLKQLVGDADTRVRLETARTLKSINYAAALDAMLAQLSLEQDTEVKITLISAVARTGDLKALPLLRKLLHDPSLRVATAAAQGFREGAAGKALGEVLYQGNKALAHDVAQEILSAMDKRRAEAGAEAFQAACLEALAPLHDSALVIPMTRLLTPEEPERLRIGALRVLGELGDPDSEDAVKAWLGQESQPNVRLEALDALGKTGSFALDAETLYSYFGPRTGEQDHAVQDKAWQVFQSLLPTASEQLLSTWQNKLSREPVHQLPVLLELDRKLAKKRDLESLAEHQQTTGDTYIKLGNYKNAADYFQLALTYWQSQHAENQTTVVLVQSLLTALLESLQYDRATQFAAESIAASREQQLTVGPLIRDQVGKLYKQAGDSGGASNPFLQNAARLVDAAMKMKPPLDDQYLDDLKQYQKDIKRAMSRSGSESSSQ